MTSSAQNSPEKTLAVGQGSTSQSQTLINAFFKEHTVLKTLLKDFRDGVLISDRGACVVQLNSSLKKLWHLDDQILGQAVSRVVSNKPFNEAMAQLLNDGTARVVEMSWRGTGGRLFFETHLIPIWIPQVKEGETVTPLNAEKGLELKENAEPAFSLDEENQNPEMPDGCVAIFHNITERRRTEKMRRDFVANVSHELRTPLSAITGYSETLLEDGLLEGEGENLAISRDFVQVIHRHSLRLTQLVEDLLDLSKLESPDYQPELVAISLEPLIRQAMSVVEDRAEEKDIHLSAEIGDELLPKVLAESNSLQQVLINLLDNAVKYTPSEGKVVISAHVVSSGDGINSPEVEVKVCDNGMGIESKYLPRVFERFYRVDKARSRDMGGTGLGLAIVKHIVQLHGGEIKVESAVNKGSTFHFRLRTDAS